MVEDVSDTVQIENISSPSCSPISTPIRCSTSCSEDNKENPTRKVRSLRDIYDLCTFALMVTKPTHYDEACGIDE